jgi:hypothetical protein
MRQKTYEKARFGGGDPCAGGCGRLSVPRSIYCEECRDIAKHDIRDVPPPQTEHDLDVVTEVLEEQMRGGTSIQDRIVEEGTGECGLCRRPTLPWRIYCSPGCRGRAARLGPALFELDGVMDSLAGHSRRCGFKKDTICQRVSRGMDPIEALTTPLDERSITERIAS